MKITIVGPGAIGCLLYACFSKAKSKEHEFWMLDNNKDRAAKLCRNGISVEGIAGQWQVPVRAACDIKDIGKTDLVILCVKSYDTKAAITAIKELVTDNTHVLTLQNGIGNIEIIGEIIGPDHVVGGITNLGATLLDVGNVRYAGKGETVIGRLDSKMSVQMRAIRELFNKAGLDARISQDIKGLLWSKLIINCGINPLTAITRLPNGKLLDFDASRKIMRETVTEAVKVAKRKRIKLLYDDPLAKVESVCEATCDNMSSMLQDIQRKKRTEVDFINGVIVRFGQELGIAVPVNSVLVDIIKTVEASYKQAI